MLQQLLQDAEFSTLHKGHLKLVSDTLAAPQILFCFNELLCLCVGVGRLCGWPGHFRGPAVDAAAAAAGHRIQQLQRGA